MTQLLDHRGLPIQKSTLKQEVAAPSLLRMRSPYSPQVGELTPEFIAMALRHCEYGQRPERYLALAESMEERDLHYRSVLATRKMALCGREIIIEAASDSRADKKIAAFARVIFCADEFADIVGDQQDALGKGFSIGEIIWDLSGSEWRPADVLWRDPRHFGFPLDSPMWPQRRDGAQLLPLEPYKFVVHLPKLKSGLPLRGGLARCAAWAFMAKNYTLKDWLAFSEVYGMPLRIGKYPLGAVSDDAIAVLQDAVQAIGSDFAAVIPENMLIEIKESSSKGASADLYLRLAEYLDKQVSKGVLGQTETADATPGRLGAASEKEAVREDILRFDARQNIITNKRDLLTAAVRLNYGPDAALPTLRYNLPEADEREILTEAVKTFVPLGWKVDGAWLRDKYGVPDPEDNAELLGQQPVASGALPVDSGAVPGNQPASPTALHQLALPTCPHCAAHAAELAIADPTSPTLLPVAYADQLAANAAEPLRAMLETIRQAVEQADSLEALRDRLLTMYPDLPTDQLREVMSLGFSVATLAGRWQADE